MEVTKIPNDSLSQFEGVNTQMGKFSFLIEKPERCENELCHSLLMAFDYIRSKNYTYLLYVGIIMLTNNFLKKNGVRSGKSIAENPWIANNAIKVCRNT